MKESKKNDKAVTSLILGVLAVLISFSGLGAFSIILGVISVIFGIVSLIKENKTVLSVIGIVLAISGVLLGTFGTDTYNNTTQKTNETVNQITQNNTVQEPAETEEEYISKCNNFTYKEIARNPNNYKGKRAKFTGEVIQVQEGYNNNVVLRVNITKGEYGMWEDTIWVDYKYTNSNESKILEDDIINIYGEMQGQKSYTSILGSQVTLPQINAKYISIVK